MLLIVVVLGPHFQNVVAKRCIMSVFLCCRQHCFCVNTVTVFAYYMCTVHTCIIVFNHDSVLVLYCVSHTAAVCMQVMAVLSEALQVHGSSTSLQLQTLSALLTYVKALATHAPQLLERIAAQVAVVLLPVLECNAGESNDGQVSDVGKSTLNQVPAGLIIEGAGGRRGTTRGSKTTGVQANGENVAVNEEALQMGVAVLHEVIKQRKHVRKALQRMPPLPSVPALAEINTVLAQVSVEGLTDAAEV